ncbi:uncharacterized protein LOC124916165 [Impatiens glandulifera]|uniref:uncharacterized protein LOC124916165 n=1 Tax=Impatiens glandulifera TaxID=253017 RepID=UPI001FB0BE36|nr:uncharacterized protein LOC124916165 [Impatiens glandulifera]
MAGSESQKHLLKLIREFATEKSQGERRIANLRKRVQELQTKLDCANAELEEAKGMKEEAEQELIGYEVELAISGASIQTLQTRTSLIQSEISRVGPDLESLKVLTMYSIIPSYIVFKYDNFISKMLELNSQIRKFQEEVACLGIHEGNSSTVSPNDGCHEFLPDADQEPGAKESDITIKALEQSISDLISQTRLAELEYQSEQDIHKQLQNDLTDIERKIFLMEEITKETFVLQDLTMQTSELENTVTSLGEELQRRCICPYCHADNADALDRMLRATDENQSQVLCWTLARLIKSFFQYL